MTIGEERVRLTFNPSGNLDVQMFKGLSADLINVCDEHMKKARSPEQARCFALAQTAYEEAAMWAVKGATFTK